MSESEFWQRAAAFSFALWAMAIPIAVGMIAKLVNRIVDEQRRFLAEFHSYVLVTENRLTRLEVAVDENFVTENRLTRLEAAVDENPK